MSKKSSVDPALERAIADLLREVIKDPQADLDAKLKVIDRAMKLEALKGKLKDEKWGSAFDTDLDDDAT